jgi:hypothetical protein
MATKKSGKKECKGVIHSSSKCKLSRSSHGQPIQIKGPCKTCSERRCRTHCKCGRNKTATGQRAARPGGNGQTVKPKVETPPKDQVVAQAKAAGLGRLGVTVYRDASWFQACLEEVRTAAKVDIASFLFDDPEFTRVLVQRLKGRMPFSCQVFVDKAAFNSRTSRHQSPRLHELKQHGAIVKLCSGYDASNLFGASAHKGIMHFKAIIIDQSIGWSGGSNVTKSARANRELMYRFQGHPVADIEAAVQDLEGSAEEL